MSWSYSGRSLFRVTFWGINGSVILLHTSLWSRLGTNSSPLKESSAGGLLLESVWIVPSRTYRKEMLCCGHRHHQFPLQFYNIQAGQTSVILTFTYGRPHPIVPGPAKRVTAVVIVCAPIRYRTLLANSILESESGQGKPQKVECNDVRVAWPGSTYPWRTQLRKHSLGSDGKEHPEKSKLSRDHKHFKHTK